MAWRTPKKQVCNRCGEDHAEQLKNIWNCTWNETAEKVDKITETYEKTALLSKFMEALLKLGETQNSALKIKIKQEFQTNTVLLKKLKRYQISLDPNDIIYKNNSVIHALKQTNLFDDSIINEMQISCSVSHPTIDELDKLGNQFNICFRIVKFKPCNNRWDDITQGKKCIGNPSGSLIELALIENHYILNERVDEVSSYALKNYKDVDEILKEKDDSYKLKVIKQSNGRYCIDSKQAHIKSYELMRLVIQNNIDD